LPNHTAPKKVTAKKMESCGFLGKENDSGIFYRSTGLKKAKQ